VALSTAQLSEELAERQREVEILQGRYVREAWERLAEVKVQGGTNYGKSDVRAFDRRLRSASGLPDAEAADGSSDQDPLAPMSTGEIGDMVLRVVGQSAEQGVSTWTDEQREVAKAISNQMTLIFGGSRLFEEARLRAVRERRAREITARIRESLDVDTILRTAVQEIGESLGIAEVEIRMGGEAEEAPQWTQTP
jgi:hypothetical protein